MAENVLIDRGLNDTYGIRLTAEGTTSGKDDYLAAVSVQGLTIIESIGSLVPYMSVKLIDQTADLINVNPIIPDGEFNLTIGKGSDVVLNPKFKISSYQVEALDKDNLGNLFLNAHLVSSKWEKLIKVTKNRSWSDSYYSDAVNDIATELELTPDIEPTYGMYNIIQPNWTNSNFIKWLANNSISQESQLGGYFYCTTFEDTLLFKTFDKAFQQKPIKEISHFSLGGQLQDKVGFNTFGVKADYMPVLNYGGFGMNYTFFDYDSKTFTDTNLVLTDMEEIQLSDWYYVGKTHVEPSKFYYGGRNTLSQDIVQNRILKSTNSVNSVDIIIEGDIDFHAGQLIDLRVPTLEYHKQEMVINELYSGYWLIWKVAHVVDVAGANFTTHLYLTRSGINGVDVTGLVQTVTGKVLE